MDQHQGDVTLLPYFLKEFVYNQYDFLPYMSGRSHQSDKGFSLQEGFLAKTHFLNSCQVTHFFLIVLCQLSRNTFILLSCQFFRHKTFCNSFYFNICRIYIVITFFIPNIGYLCPLSSSTFNSVQLQVLQFCLSLSKNKLLALLILFVFYFIVFALLYFLPFICFGLLYSPFSRP